jgi:hippurate hydrolase
MKLLLVALLAGSTALAAETPTSRNPALSPLDALYPELEALYKDLHQNPELSLQEEKTSAKMAARLKALGYGVTTGVGGYGVVAVMKNGTGPTILLRADMDALPVEEKTGLPYASKATARNAAGETVPVMHACGHDVHMTALVGAATLLARAKDRWRGTLVLVGQPAEEGGGGARKMLDDGFLTRFPKPDYALSMHDSAVLPAGQIGMTPGYAFANVDSVDITIYGRGGHGSKPEATIDPIVIAARTVLALQAIVARENSPFDPAVVTVGSIHGGLKHNIIPDEVKLQLTVRSYKEEVRRRILAAIERIAKTEAAVSNAPKEPTVTVSEGTNALYNDPDLSRRLTQAYVAAFGTDRVTEARPVMAGEDFGEFGRAAKAPSVLVWIGAVDPKKFAEAKGNEATLPYLHSSLFAPDPEPTVKAGAAAMTVGALELLGKP